MNKIFAVTVSTMICAAWFMPQAMAQSACVTSQAGMPAGANSTDKAAPFFID